MCGSVSPQPNATIIIRMISLTPSFGEVLHERDQSHSRFNGLKKTVGTVGLCAKP